MEVRNTDIVTQRLHRLLARLSAQNSNSLSLQNQTSSTNTSKSPNSHLHTERRAWTRNTLRTSPRVSPSHIAVSGMGIKGTDDYLTARAANPRTGLISPSVVTNLTPRTPISPAEALSLFGDGQAYSSEVPTRVKSPERRSPVVSRPKPAGPRGRWRQDSTGWNMEPDTEAGSPNLNTANSSATRADFHASEDSFVIPMPTAKDPQPYRQEDQDRAVQYYKDKAQRLLQKEGLNGRMHSIGAGPRKFAQATKALRDFSNPRSSSPAEQHTTVGQDKSVTSSPTLSEFPAFEKPHSPQLSRRPVCSTAPGYERRDSGVDVTTPTSSHENEAHSPTMGGAERGRANSNTSRFQDLRQLPRVRVVHPDGSVNKGHHASEKTAHSPREYTATPPPPYPSHQSTPSISGASVAESLSPLETQVVGFLAWAINQIFCRSAPRPDGSSKSHSIGITQAIHILSDSATKPIERWQAIKALAFTALRVIMILCCIAIVVRIGTAVGRVLAILLWPVSVVWTIVKWILGLG
ncbi:hypothetical protein D6D19_03250 [Aureobasidium pullulans]|uniref:Uncharacterized protein n=1 Tax=Aureobasidium pullulans TaxID=5580 RepID=A0A4S9AAK2_AURPU|nr:hypothetical protein D6D19_03250 [Aureobasidium pullulans]